MIHIRNQSDFHSDVYFLLLQVQLPMDLAYSQL